MPDAIQDVPVDRTKKPIPPELIHLTEPFENGYHFPPKYPFGETCKHAWSISWRWVLTIKGFLITIYGLNVVAWGGMLFLLLCNASPAMCIPNCDDKATSPRQIWLEIASQILNALFCVTGFGLAPWRFRDLYYLMKYRISDDFDGIRTLAGIHKGWFRLPESQTLPLDVGPDNLNENVPRVAIPLPEKKTPKPPLSGMRAPPTAIWKLDAVIWLFVWNTFLQIGLATCMWAMDRFNRPPAVTGILVGFGCVVAMIGGQIMGSEGSSVKSVEGIPLDDEDRERLRTDEAKGILHYNNKKDKLPKEIRKAAKDKEAGEKISV
ncbi:hypothetical protein MCOR27_002365 [Pyricularia oryzae]|nr:hypothetical protein MCOR01_004141 [Pyricularia oryzae]KAH9430793.1 hypothetical protein MCOR02_008121 [Pyricularia oryzae]KAI6257367.1 hypothetical protein MCOR19_006224 [Pyricularia oryzae]KAI6285216.1 hypothetical protein MCOR27_002365 [Pyricularia oryzae]KAI6314651.1 hypothetical protein MCOR29_007315 [Pyricularia oryzae]